jgi:hypothetical protein
MPWPVNDNQTMAPAPSFDLRPVNAMIGEHGMP